MVGVHSVRRRGQIYLARVCFLLFRGWEFVVFVCVFCCFVVVNVYAGTINRRIRWVFVAYTVGVRSVHGGCLQHIRLLLVAYIMVVCTVFSG